MSVKRITLRLYCTLRMSWVEQITVPRNATVKPIRYEKILFEHEWQNLEAGNRTNNNITPSTTGTHTLAPGNHELPFELILPGSVEESVEGLEGAQVVYKLVATIERGRFANNIVTKKHMRVVRTLSSDALELSQSMSMDNVWPDKVEYQISIPAKAIAVGSFTPINLRLVPMLKGLKLGRTKITLYEYTSLSTGFGINHETEKAVHESVIPEPLDGFEGQDEWIVDYDFMLPSSLSRCTQDCQIGNYINVTHKLKFAISLLNPDGHVSELRASLPAHLFISPNVSITSLHPTISAPGASEAASAAGSGSGSGSGAGAGAGAGSSDADPTALHEDHLFASSVSSSGVTSVPGADSNAPPNYQDRIYDRLWREIPDSAIASPFTSEPGTPFARSRRNSSELLDNMGLNPVDRSRLLSNLYALQERQNRGEDGGPTSAVPSRFSSRSTSGANTPHESGSAGGGGLMMMMQQQYPDSPEFSHFSHPASPSFSGASGSAAMAGSPVENSMLDLESLSRVPSYHTAVNTDAGGSAESAPSYTPSQPPSPVRGGSRSRVTLSGLAVGSSKQQQQQQQRPVNSAPGSALNLHSLNLKLTRASRGAVDGSSSLHPGPSSMPQTRSASATNLFGMGHGHSKKGSGSGFFRTSSKTHLSGLSGLSMTANGSSHSSHSSLSHSNGNGNNSSGNGSGSSTPGNGDVENRRLSNANRTSSSRSLMDEASRFLHFTKKSSSEPRGE